MNDNFLKSYDSILEIKELTLSQKYILHEIINLCSVNGCFARRSHFAKKFSISRDSVTKHFSNLEDKGYIFRDKFIDYDYGGRFDFINLTDKTKKLLPNDINIIDIKSIGVDSRGKIRINEDECFY